MTRKWLVVYTKPQHEVKSYNYLCMHNIKAYLPLYKELRQWSDRKKWVEKPLFPGYLFVFVSNKEYFNVLSCPSIIKYIFHNGVAATVDNRIIAGIEKQIKINNGENIEAVDVDFEYGQEIVLKTGPFKGLTGKLVQFKGKHKIAIELECMNRRILIETRKAHVV